MKLGLWRWKYLYQSVKKEGPLEGYNIAWEKHSGMLAMEAAARAGLPALTVQNGPAPEASIHFLTGASHFYMTVFCAYSLCRVTPHPLDIVVHDDGTLSEEVRGWIRASLPTARFLDPAPTRAATEAFLPKDRFPSLWKARERLVLMRKLMDVHAPAPGWKLFLDSDMLFFSPPHVLLDWMRSPAQPCCMTDVTVAYGYPEPRLAALAGAPMPEFVNTGICGLERGRIDWEKLEFWSGRLMEEFGINHFLEQGMTAMLLATLPFQFMPRRDYICCPLREQVTPRPDGVMHHYVSDSRTHYYRHGWRHILAPASQAVRP